MLHLHRMTASPSTWIWIRFRSQRFRSQKSRSRFSSIFSKIRQVSNSLFISSNSYIHIFHVRVQLAIADDTGSETKRKKRNFSSKYSRNTAEISRVPESSKINSRRRRKLRFCEAPHHRHQLSPTSIKNTTRVATTRP